MIRDVLKMGDPRLLEIAEPVENFGTPELRELLTDMHDTMGYLDGAIQSGQRAAGEVLTRLH